MKSTGSIYNTPLGQVDASSGQFRKGNVSAGGSYFMNYDRVETSTQDFARKYYTDLSIVKTDKEKLELSLLLTLILLVFIHFMMEMDAPAAC